MKQFHKMLKAGVTAWKIRRDWFGDSGVPVSPELAQQRADICLKCPYNQEMPVWELFASAVAFAVKQQLKLKSELKLRVNGEENLHVCSACLCVNSLKAWTPLKFILEYTEPEVMDSFHKEEPECWILLEQQEQQNLQHDNKDQRISER